MTGTLLTDLPREGSEGGWREHTEVRLKGEDAGNPAPSYCAQGLIPAPNDPKGTSESYSQRIICACYGPLEFQQKTTPQPPQTPIWQGELLREVKAAH